MISNQYNNEVIEKWGTTEAYKEYSEKSKKYTKEKWNDILSGMDDIFHLFSVCMKNNISHDSLDAQNIVLKLRNYINENFYNCTVDILYGLGQMYVSDERFKNNIDKHSIGTAEFVSKAIEVYCLKNI